MKQMKRILAALLALAMMLPMLGVAEEELGGAEAAQEEVMQVSEPEMIPEAEPEPEPEPVPAEPEATEPEVVEPEADAPEVVEPEVVVPEIVEPENTAPEVQAPETQEPGVEEPGTEEIAPLPEGPKFVFAPEWEYDAEANLLTIPYLPGTERVTIGWSFEGSAAGFDVQSAEILEDGTEGARLELGFTTESSIELPVSTYAEGWHALYVAAVLEDGTRAESAVAFRLTVAGEPGAPEEAPEAPVEPEAPEATEVPVVDLTPHETPEPAEEPEQQLKVRVEKIADENLRIVLKATVETELEGEIAYRWQVLDAAAYQEAVMSGQIDAEAFWTDIEGATGEILDPRAYFGEDVQNYSYRVIAAIGELEAISASIRCEESEMPVEGQEDAAPTTPEELAEYLGVTIEELAEMLGMTVDEVLALTEEEIAELVASIDAGVLPLSAGDAAMPVVTRGGYNATAAIEYAMAHNNAHPGSSYSNEFTHYAADCTNFVSQCLYKGGIAQDSTWKPYTYAWKYTGPFIRHFANDLHYATYIRNTVNNSGSLHVNNPKAYSISASNIHPGDVIFVNGVNASSGDSYLYGHAMLVDHVSPNNLYVFCHGHSQDVCGCTSCQAMVRIDNPENSVNVVVCLHETVGSTAATSIQLNRGYASLDYSQSVSLSATVSPSNATLTWSTSNSNVASISATSGGSIMVWGVNSGTATITCSSGNARATCTVEVRTPDTLQITGVDYPATYGIKNSSGGWTLSHGTVYSDKGLKRLTTDIQNANRQSLTKVTKDISGNRYEIKNFDANVFFGYITRGGIGTYYWILTAEDQKGRSVSLEMKINAVNSTSITVAGAYGVYSWKYVSQVYLPYSSVSVERGKSIKLAAEVYPTDARNRSVTWSSNNTGIATVNADGTVTGVKEGQTTLVCVATDGSGCSASLSVTVTAPKDGWQQEDGQWYYYESGEKKTGWLQINGQRYYLGTDGAMQTGWVQVGGKWYYLDNAMATGWKLVDGKWYYMDGSGAMQTGWLQLGGKWYYLNSAMATGWVQDGSKWYYMDAQGVMQTGWVQVSGNWYYLNNAMVTGWQKIDGKWYSFTANGVMENAKTGWQLIGGKWYYLNADRTAKTGWLQLSGKWYYLGTNGAMATGWAQVGGKWYYLDAHGVMQTGWVQVSGKWYYLNNAMATDWVQVGGKWYYLNSNGVMQTGWVQVSGKWYYLNNAMATGWVQVSGKWYYLNSNGAMATGWLQLGGNWYYLNNAMVTGWQKIDGKWYSFTANGVMENAKTGWQSIGGKWYYLNADRTAKTGWLQLSGKWYFLGSNGIMVTGWAQVNGAWYYLDANGAMKTGWLTLGNKTYYLKSNGAMVTGWQQIDGKWYNFDSNGALIA